ncbi:MAG: S8 family serine peptidase [Bdellovibrionales bacterium]|nr:S8 family serine peptidase [Bdellovibrionales bacterium]
MGKARFPSRTLDYALMEELMENGFSRVSPKLALALVAAALALGNSSAVYAGKKARQAVEHVPGEIVVKLKEAVSARAAHDVFASILGTTGRGAALQAVEPFRTDKQLFTVRVAEDGALGRAISSLKADSRVEIAEPNFIYRTFEAGIPNDTDFDKNWSLLNNGQADAAGQTGTPGSDIDVVPLWAAGHTGSREVVVGVIDTGVEWTHSDLVDNLWTNPGEIAGNAKDDDNNGFVDDVHGWNFVANNANSSDDHSHGTHCSGTIGGTGNNGKGIAGVNWQVSIVPIKFLSASGSGSLDDAVESINYATSIGVNIMSNSWGGGGFSETMKQAIEKSRDAGILFVAAAGNSSSDNDSNPAYPASYQVENVVSVAATDNRDRIASFSNYGKSSVHVAAPGVKVYSSVKGDTYASYSGTSMACPHVAGIAALLMASNQTWSFSDVKSRLITTSDPVRGLRRMVASRGRVNAYNAFHGIVPPSNEPDESLWARFEAAGETPHPYENSKSYTYTVTKQGARYIRVNLEKVDVESGYDKVQIETPAGEVIETITGRVENYTTDYAEGDTLVIRLVTDSSVNGWGMKIGFAQSITQ